MIEINLIGKLFIDSYNAVVHESKLLNVEHFNYLRRYFTGQAAKNIKGLSLTDRNYIEAMNLLEERYSNVNLIISKHVHELVKI